MSRFSVLHCFVVWTTLLGAGHVFVQGLQESQSHPFHLICPAEHPVPGFTKDFALRCESNPDATTKPSVRVVSKVRIVKKTSEDEWKVVALQAVSGEPDVTDPRLAALGRVIPPVVEATFLEVRWPEVDDDTLGVYRCDVMGTNAENEADLDMSAEVELKMGEIPSETLVSLLVQAKQDIDTQITQNTEDIEGLKVQKGSSGPDGLDTDQALLNKYFLPRSTAIAWPEGEYALLQPNSGCPVDLAFFGGNSGFVRLHTESTDVNNENNLHPLTHLSQPIITRSGSNVFFYLRFCVVTREFSDTPWPEGSYCINAKGNGCPAGFEQGKISLDTEDHQNADMSGGNVPFTSPSDLLFCCRSSQNPTPNPPIVLPTESPFYLYRLGGSCQQVKDMNVVEEFMEIATESFINHDSSAGSVPDSNLNKGGLVRIELCYYSKQ